MIDLQKLTIKKTHEHLKNGDFSVKELVKVYLDEINTKNNDINAYLEIYDDVLEQAERADDMIKSGQIKSLTGIPFAIKDNILIKGKKATSASKILEGFVSPYDATVIQKLKNQGAVFLGRANMDEFAMGGSTENSAFGVTKNPVDRTRVSGGSSGGSVAAVAMDGALVALGSDTGGSVREPASFCGVVGLKPTYGSVSRHGLMAMGSSLDVIGPITKNVSDAEIVFDAIKGLDPMDSTSIDFDLINKNKSKNKIGVPFNLIKGEGIEESVRKNFDDSIEKLKNLGYEIVDVDLKDVEYSLAVYYILMPAEVSSNLARFDGVKYGSFISGKDLLDDYVKTRGLKFGKEARRRILIGTYVLSAGYHDAYYTKALILRQNIKEQFNKVFQDVDLILTPTVPFPAFKIGEKANDPLSMYLADIFTVPANIVGIPAISIPSGFTEKDGVNLPLGIQFMAPHLREDLLFDVGKKFLDEN